MGEKRVHDPIQNLWVEYYSEGWEGENLMDIFQSFKQDIIDEFEIIFNTIPCPYCGRIGKKEESK